MDPLDEAFAAIAAGDLAALWSVIGARPSLVGVRREAEAGQPETLLWAAVDARPADPSLPAALLALGADANAPRTVPDGDLLLGVAASQGRTGLCGLLIEAGADVQAAPGHGTGMPPLPSALFAGHTATAEWFALNGVALGYDHAAGIGWLHEMVGVEESPAQRWSAFLYACKNGQLEVVEYLVPRGLDLTVYPPGSDWGGVGASGMHWAAHHGHHGLAVWLARAGTPLTLTDDAYGSTAMGWALMAGHDAIALALFELGSDTSLQTLAALGLVDQVAAELDVDPALADGWGKASPLRAAAFYGRDEVVDLLLERGADPTRADAEGRTASVIAIARGFAALGARLADAEAAW